VATTKGQFSVRYVAVTALGAQGSLGLTIVPTAVSKALKTS
jgi:hypothetical protein